MQTDQLIDMYFNFTCSWTWYLALIYIKPVGDLEIALVLVNEALRFQRIHSQRISTRWKLCLTQSPTLKISIGPTNPHDDRIWLNITYSCVVWSIQYTVQCKMVSYWRITFTNNKYVLYLFILYCCKLIQSRKYITYSYILSINLMVNYKNWLSLIHIKIYDKVHSILTEKLSRPLSYHK